MTSLTLSWFGPPEQKHVVKVTAMQTLADVLQAASSKFKPALQHEQCELHLGKKPLDLRTPFRLLNVPAGSKLEIIKKDVPRETAAPTPTSAPAATHAAEPAAAAAAAPAPPPPPAAVDQLAGAPAVAPRQVSFVAPDASVTPAADPLPPARSTAAVAAAADAAPASSAEPAAAAAAAAAQPSSTVDPALAALGVRVPVYVFHHRALEAAAAAKAPSPMELDPPDDFFELTAEDLQRLQAQAAAKRKAESVFRTRTAREAESAARAAAMGPVRVRLHLPDGTLLQSDFKATDALHQVQELLCKLAAPELAPGLYLYTTPPKTLLKDAAASLYSLQLVPAAHIHVGFDEKKAKAAAPTGSGWLRPEVQALMQDSMPEQHQAAQQEPEEDAVGSSSSADAAAAAQRAARLAAAASRQASSSTAAGGGKVPKWFKK